MSSGRQTRDTVARRLAPLYVAGALQAFVLWYAIEKPFLQRIGLSWTQMAALIVVLNVVLVVANVPLGVIADRSSRKGVLIGAAVTSALTCVTASVSHDFAGYLVAMVLFGLFLAGHSGAYDSVIYDLILEECGDDTTYTRRFGRLKLIEGVTLAISSLLGGVAAWALDPRVAYALSVPFALGSIAALALFREPTRHLRRAAHAPRTRLFGLLRELLARDDTRPVLVTLLVVSDGIALLSYLDQVWLLALGLPILLYGPVNAGLLASMGIGGHVAHRGGALLHRDVAVAIAVLLACIGLLVASTPVVVIAQYVALGGFTMLSISLGQRLHAATPSDVRASVSSAVATAGTVCFAPIALAFGVISEHASVFTAAWIAVVLGALTLIGVDGVRRSAARSFVVERPVASAAPQ